MACHYLDVAVLGAASAGLLNLVLPSSSPTRTVDPDLTSAAPSKRLVEDRTFR
jgi:hypothetical protein